MKELKASLASVRVENLMNSRRNFAKQLLKFCGSLFLASSFLSCQRKSSGPRSGTLIVLNPKELSSLKDGITAVPAYNLYIHQQGGEILAVRDLICTHQRCQLKVSLGDGNQQQLLCPCHGARFSQKGEVLEGPAKKPLPAYPFTVGEKGLEVDLSQRSL